MDQYWSVALSCSETLPLSSVLWLQMQCWNASSLVHLWILLLEECENLTGILISKAHGLLCMCWADERLESGENSCLYILLLVTHAWHWFSLPSYPKHKPIHLCHPWMHQMPSNVILASNQLKTDKSWTHNMQAVQLQLQICADWIVLCSQRTGGQNLGRGSIKIMILQLATSTTLE